MINYQLKNGNWKRLGGPGSKRHRRQQKEDGYPGEDAGGLLPAGESREAHEQGAGKDESEGGDEEGAHTGEYLFHGLMPNAPPKVTCNKFYGPQK